MSSLITTDRLKELLPQLFNNQKTEGDYYLRFQLTAEISAAIDLKCIQESLIINDDRLTPVPNLPEYVVGLMSSRNQVFLAVDLAHLAGLPPQTVNLRQYPTIVFRHDQSGDNLSEETNLYGFTVKRIEGISRVMPHQIHTVVDNIPDTLRPFVRGSVLANSSEITSESELSAETQPLLIIDIPQLITAKTQISSTSIS